MRREILVGVFVFLLIFPLCSKARRIDDLEAKLVLLEEKVSEAEDKTEKYKKQVESAQAELKAISLELRKENADLKTQLAQKDELIRQLDVRLKELEERVLKLEQAPKSLPMEGLTAEPAKGGSNEEFAPVTGKEIYELGLRYFNEKKYQSAIAQFEAYLESYPTSYLSDNAQFWKGECYFQMKDYKQAIIEYNKVRKNYPKGDKVPASLLKIAISFEKIGEKQKAELFLKELIQSYPSSNEAKEAKKKLGISP